MLLAVSFKGLKEKQRLASMWLACRVLACCMRLSIGGRASFWYFWTTTLQPHNLTFGLSGLLLNFTNKCMYCSYSKNTFRMWRWDESLWTVVRNLQEWMHMKLDTHTNLLTENQSAKHENTHARSRTDVDPSWAEAIISRGLWGPLQADDSSWSLAN